MHKLVSTARNNGLPNIRCDCVASAAIATGRWVTMSGTTGKFAVLADNGTVVHGLANNAALADGDLIDIVIPDQNDIFEGPYIGSFDDTDIGAQFGYDNAASTYYDAVDQGNTTAGQIMFQLVSYNSTAGTCRYKVVPAYVSAAV
jgi:hypothetical protein